MLLLPHLLHLGRSIPNPRFVQLCQCIVDVIVQSDLLASSTPPPAPSAAPLGNSLLLPSIVQWLEKFIDEEDPDETKTTQAMAVPLMKALIHKSNRSVQTMSPLLRYWVGRALNVLMLKDQQQHKQQEQQEQLFKSQQQVLLLSFFLLS